MNKDKAQIHRWVREFLFNKPLYAPTEISLAAANALLADHLVVDGYCPYCRKTSTFHRNLGSEDSAYVEALLDGNESHFFNLNCTHDVTHNIMFLFRFGEKRIEKIGQYPPPARIADYTCRTKRSSAGEAFRSIGLLVGVVVAVIGIFELYESAKGQANLRRQFEQIVQRADANAAGISESQIPIVAQRFDDRFATFGKDLKVPNYSISHDNSLIFATDMRLDKQEPDASKPTALVKEGGETRKDDPPPNPSVPHLGIQVALVTPKVAKVMGLAKKHGVVVVMVDSGSPAERAGVQRLDLILKVDGTVVNSPDQMREALFSLKGRHAIVLTLKREGETQDVKLSLGRDEFASPFASLLDGRLFGIVGASVCRLLQNQSSSDRLFAPSDHTLCGDILEGVRNRRLSTASG